MENIEDEYTAKAPQTAEARRRLMSKQSIFDEKRLLEDFEKEGIKLAHAYTIWRYLIQLGTSFENIDQIPNIPLKAIRLIQNNYTITSQVVHSILSKDESTTKLLIQLFDKQKIESVIMRYGAVPLASFPQEMKEKMHNEQGLYTYKSTRRATLCVSSQIGCNMGCKFCATGTMGLLSSLTTGEILEQLYHANQIEKIRNIVFMGMGEPLVNYQEVITSIRAMIDVKRFNLSPSRISISTVGIINRIKSLAKDVPGVSLALSLHAPNQSLREEIVPSSKSYRLEKILDAVNHFLKESRDLIHLKHKADKVFVLLEYVLIAGVNDSSETAHELGRLLTEKNSVNDFFLNVIPYNPTDVIEDYAPPSEESKNNFLEIIRGYNVKMTFRQELGQDVAAACGQLVVKTNREEKRGEERRGEEKRREERMKWVVAGVVAGVIGLAALMRWRRK